MDDPTLDESTARRLAVLEKFMAKMPEASSLADLQPILDRVAALETQVARIEATLGEMAQSVAKLVNGGSA
jgi:hypothetical protein